MSTARPSKLFEVDISIQNNTLIVGASGGNIAGRPGDRILWRARHGVPTFTLQFFQLGAEPAKGDECTDVPRVQELPQWPFTGEVPPHGIAKANREGIFEGTLAEHPNAATGFKYSVIVGNLQLDPVVIVDRL
jgi:hypothetical protein